MNPAEPVAYVWLVDRVGGHKQQLLLQRVSQDEDLAIEVLEEMAADYEDRNTAVGSSGIAPLGELLRGGDLQDAVQQLSRASMAAIDLSAPRTRAIPHRQHGPGATRQPWIAAPTKRRPARRG